MAVETLRDEERGFEDRTRIAVADYRQEVLHCDTLLSGCWRRCGAAFALRYTIGRLLAIARLATAGALDGRKAADYTRAPFLDPTFSDEPFDAHLFRHARAALCCHVARLVRCGRDRELRNRLEGRSRAWRVLPGDRDRHLQKVRARGEPPAGRAASQSRAIARRGGAGLQHRVELVRAAQFRSREHPDG